MGNEFAGDRDAVRDKIVKAAQKAFRIKGIKAVRMDDIVRDINISKRTLYQIFNDKDELVIECLRRHHDEEEHLLSEVTKTANNVLEIILLDFNNKMRQMEQTCPQFHKDVQCYPTVMAYFKERREENMGLAVEFLERGKKEGIFRQEINFRTILRLLINQLDYAMEQVVNNGLDFREVFYCIVIVTFRGCSTTLGQQIIEDFIQKNANGPLAMPKLCDDEK